MENNKITTTAEDLKAVISETVIKTKTEIETAIKEQLQAELTKQAELIKSDIAKSLPAQPTVTTIDVKPAKNRVGKLLQATAVATLKKIEIEPALKELGYEPTQIVNKNITPLTMEGGGVLIPSMVYPELLDMLKEESVVLSAQPNILDMPNGNMSLSVRTEGSTAVWRALTDTKTTGSMKFKKINMVATSLAARVPFADASLRYGGANTAALIERFLIEDISLQLDETILRTGTGTNNTPYSISGLAKNSNAITTSVTSATIESDIRKLLIGKLQVANAKFIRPVIFTTRTVKSGIMARNDSNNTKMGYANELMEKGTVFGIPVIETNVLYTNAGKTQSEVILVDMGYAYWGVGKQLSVRLDIFGSYFSGGVTISGQNTNEHVFDCETECAFELSHTDAAAKLTACTWDA